MLLVLRPIADVIDEADMQLPRCRVTDMAPTICSQRAGILIMAPGVSQALCVVQPGVHLLPLRLQRRASCCMDRQLA